MSATAAKPAELKVSIDDAFRSTPELFDAIHAAQLYFESQYLDEPSSEDLTRKAEIRWESALGGKLVRVELSERDNLGHRILSTSLTLVQMLDDVARDVAMIRLWRAVLRKRSHVRMHKLDLMITELEEQEALNADSN